MDRPVIDSEHPRDWPIGLWLTTNVAQKGIRADRHPERGREACPTFTAEGKRNCRQRRPLAARALLMRRRYVSQTFSEDAARAGRVVTEEPSDADLQSDGQDGPGQIGQRALVATMDAIGTPTTQRTARRLVVGRG